MQRYAGFTLAELIVVIAVLALAAAVAIPGYLGWLPDIRLSSMIRNLKSDLALARQRAIRENGQVAVVFDIPNNRYTIFVDNGAGDGNANDWERHADEAEIKTITLPEDVTMYAAAFAGGSPRIRFDGRGLPNGLGGHVYLRNAKRNFRGLVMTMVGRIRTKISLDGGESWDDAE